MMVPASYMHSEKYEANGGEAIFPGLVPDVVLYQAYPWRFVID
jgi:hypothetical protein